MDDIRKYQDVSVFERPWTTVFYSFRGGVGRTTLAVSSAFGLRGIETPVGLIDFDLEAPGFGAFKCLSAPKDQPGIVEYVDAYRNADVAPPIGPYVFKADKAPDESPEDDSAADKRGQLWAPIVVMRAGRGDGAYRKMLSRLDWSYLYRCEDGRKLFENLRLGFRFDFHCNHLLIDSRTGVTEIGGACLGHLADAVVIVFEPQFGHASGLKAVVNAIKHREQVESRPIPRLYVACRVPVGRGRVLDESVLSNAREMYQFLEGEWVFAKGDDGQSISRECTREFWQPLWNDGKEADIKAMDCRTPLLAFVGENKVHGFWSDAQLCDASRTISRNDRHTPIESDYSLVCSWIELMRERALSDAVHAYIRDEWLKFESDARQITDDAKFQQDAEAFIRRNWSDIADRYSLWEELRPIEYAFERFKDANQDWEHWKHPRRRLMEDAIVTVRSEMNKERQRLAELRRKQ